VGVEGSRDGRSVASSSWLEDRKSGVKVSHLAGWDGTPQPVFIKALAGNRFVVSGLTRGGGFLSLRNLRTGH